MKLYRNFLIIALFSLFILILTGCTDSSTDANDVSIELEADKTHYLKFIENNVEILRIVVIEGETYEDLLPFFPTLSNEEGYIKYWDGDYEHTQYSKDNQFSVYSEDQLVIEIYSQLKKIK